MTTNFIPWLLLSLVAGTIAGSDFGIHFTES